MQLLGLRSRGFGFQSLDVLSPAAGKFVFIEVQLPSLIVLALLSLSRREVNTACI